MSLTRLIIYTDGSGTDKNLWINNNSSP